MANLHIQSNFDVAAKQYQQFAQIQKEIGKRLLERFDYYNITPDKVLDLGAGPGCFSHQLKQLFRKSQVIAYDISWQMLTQIKRKWRFPIDRTVGCMQQLPFGNDVFDVIFANQVIHWADDPKQLFAEISRVLKPGGVFVFSTLGPDTFQEIRQAWLEIDDHSHVNQFTDMHLYGDAMSKANMSDPVVDMEYITMRYDSVNEIARDLKAQGVQHTGQHAKRGLTTPRQWRQFQKNYEKCRDQDNKLPLTYEVIYGQAWGKATQSDQSKAEIVVPISQLRRKHP